MQAALIQLRPTRNNSYVEDNMCDINLYKLQEQIHK